MVSTDAAVESWKSDRLGFKDYAEGVIAPVERLSKENTPFTIGVFGGWGSGKTSFMRIMQESLEARGYETIFFNSWEYGNEEKPWIPFMIKVVDKLFEKEIDKKKLIQNIFLFSTDAVLQTYSQGRVSTGGILDFIKKIRKTTPFKEWSDDDVKIVIERVTKIEEFKKKIEERAAKSPKGKIIIFIDDLDRIPEKLIDFLNSLKIFLDIKGCVFVLGCDYAILDNALKERYKEEIYEDYFDKIVQAEFYVPKISDEAIEKYLKSLTGWSDEEIKECKQLVTHSIGRNPRKIKRVVNATDLIKSVFESKLATLIEAFKKPKPRIEITRPGDKTEEPAALKFGFTEVFTPSKIFDTLFDKKVLFKLVCMREQWPRLYERILNEEEKQRNWISLQDAKNKADISKLLKAAEQKEEKLKETEKNLHLFIKDSPRFHEEIEDIKTYLTLLEISSPEAGVVVEYAEPQKLPIHLFNRYMMFERINKGKVDESVIKEKIEHMDWDSSLSSYSFFMAVIEAFGYDYLERLFENKKDLIKIAKAEKIRASSDPGAIRWLLVSVDNETAKLLVKETKDAYAEKIRASSDLVAIGQLLSRVESIDNETAKLLVNKTKDTYVEKVRTSSGLHGIGWLLYSVGEIDYETSEVLVNETKDTYAGKIRASSDPGAIGSLLRSIDNETAKVLLNETKDTYAEKIRASSDPGAIESLLYSVGSIDSETAKVLIKETKDSYAGKIRVSSDLLAIEWLLDSVRRIDNETAKLLLKETMDAYAEKIRASTDLTAIERLLSSMRRIDEEIAKILEDETKYKSE